MANAIDRLANELLHMILTPRLAVSRERVTDPRYAAFGENGTVSSALILTVCKRWLRVATPLLYETVVIRSPGQSRALADVFRANKANKEFAKHVKVLRLEGAYPYLADTLPLCTNLKTFVLFLIIFSDNNVAALCKSLPLINPNEVILHGMITNNAKSRQAFAALAEAVPKWTSLMTFEFPYDTTFGHFPQCTSDNARAANKEQCIKLLEVLVQSNNLLHAIYCPVLDLSSVTWNRLAVRPSITYKFRYSSYWDNQSAILNGVIKIEKMSKSQIEFVDIARRPSSSPPQITERHQNEHTFSRGSVEAIRDAVWIVIFRFATEWYQEDASHKGHLDWEPGVHVNATRRNIALVCQRFKGLVRPLIFETPLIYSVEALHTFSARIMETPMHGQQVHVLCLSFLREFGGNDNTEIKSWQERLDSELHQLLPHLACLQVFDNTPWLSSSGMSCAISSGLFTVLAWSTRETLRSIKGLDFAPEFRPLAFNALVLFRHLEHLGFYLYGSNHDKEAEPGTVTNANSLETLATLGLSADGWIIKALCGFRLSGVKSIVMTDVTDGVIEKFLEASAPNVEHIKFQGLANFDAVFRLAPKLLHVEWHSNQNYIPTIDKFITQSAAHDTLEVFKINGVMQPSDKEYNSFVDMFFSCLNLANFPSFKSLHLTEYEWPNQERYISRDHLPKIAIHIKQAYGVDIMDNSGKPWRPRVQLKR